MATWHTSQTIAQQWKQAAKIENTELEELLAVARHQVESFAPKLVAGSVDIPDSYRLAQKLQAQALYNSSRVDPQGGDGMEGYTVKVYPMDWNIKNILRPADPTSLVG